MKVAGMNKRIRLELKKLKQQEARLMKLAGQGMQADQGAMFPLTSGQTQQSIEEFSYRQGFGVQ